MLNERKKQLVAKYWGDFILYPLSFIIIVTFLALMNGLDSDLIVMILSVVYTVLSVLILSTALEQFFANKKRRLRDIHYIAFSSHLIIGLLCIIFSDWIILRLLLRIATVIGSAISTARPTIWLYKRHQRKRAEKTLVKPETEGPPQEDSDDMAE